MSPLYDTAEVRLTDPDFHDALAGVARQLDGHHSELVARGLGTSRPGPAVIHFAAEGSAYDVTLVPYDAIWPARASATFPIANGASGPGGIYCVRDAWGRPGARWLNAGFHDLDWVMEWCGTDSVVDAVPFAVLLNELEITRGRLHRTEWVRDAYRHWFERARGTDDDVSQHVLRWFAESGATP